MKSSPLFQAIEAGDPERMRALIAAGANLAETDEDGCFTALGQAAYLGRSAIVRLLLDAGAAADEKSATATALGAAALGGQVEAAEILVRQGASLDSADEVGLTPLMHAAHVGQLAVVRYLVESGADMDQRHRWTRYGQQPSALDYAVQEGFPEIAEYLLERGAHFQPDDYPGECGAAPPTASGLIELARKNRARKHLLVDESG
jgi:ankyrin repeat protein